MLPNAVDPQQPWLGLASFTEETRGFFHGRDEEVGELGRRVQRKLLTILFGQSGLGKTSILRAGIVPRLRPEGYCPVYVRLDYSPDSPPPAEQIKQAIFRATREAGDWTQTGVSQAGESLWEFLHHRDDVLRDRGGRTLIPLLIFDQFEEIFTLAQGDDFGRQRAAQFLADLADLVENRAPRALEARLEADEASMEKFDFTRADYRILIALREDYLAHLEGLKAAMPSVTQNRMRLARMNGAQALAAVTGPGRGLVNDEVAAQIVTFVSGAADLAHAEVEPSLLSLVCRELNETRRARGHAEISADLLAGSRDTILTEFYERTLADQPAGVRAFIEDELLTDSGYRESIAEERVKKGFVGGGANADALALLIDRRLLRVEERLDLRRVELTHDVLCSVVAASRAVRHERDAKEAAERLLAETRVKAESARRDLLRARFVAGVCVVLALIAVASALYGYRGQRRAQQTRALAETSRAEAEKLVGFLLDDFYEELAPTGRLEIVEKLAKQTVSYYDGLPSALRTPTTQRNRAMALMRQGYGSVIGQGNSLLAAEVGKKAVAEFEQLRAAGDHGEETTIGLALSLLIRGNGDPDINAAAIDRRRSVDLLRPLATRPNASRRARFEFANILNQVSHELPREDAIAMCDEARRLFAGLGALELTDLAAASAYGDTADSEARFASNLGRWADAIRLEQETAELAEKILAIRPGDLRAMQDRVYAPQLTAVVELHRFHPGVAWSLAQRVTQAARDYARYNPSDPFGWQQMIEGGRLGAISLLAQGRVADAVNTFRETAALERESRGGAQALQFLPETLARLAVLEAQLGHRDLAEQALAAAARVNAQIEHEMKVQDFFKQFGREGVRLGRIGVLLALDDGITASNEAQAGVDMIGALLQRPEAHGDTRAQLLGLFQPARAALARLLLKQGRHVELEPRARAWLASLATEAKTSHFPADEAEARTYLALALARQGRGAEALAAVEPAVKLFRDLRAQDAAGVDFCHDFAFALFAQAAAAADDEAGRGQRRAALAEAAKLLEGLTAEAKQLRDQRELIGWVAAAQGR